MKTPLFTYAWLASLMILGTSAELDEKSSRYHTMLLKKPESTAVLSRFIDAWLETADQAALTDILKAKAQAGGAADWRVLAAFYEFSGNDSEAIVALNAAVKSSPDDKTTRLARAKLLGKLLLFDQAINDLAEAVKDPNLELEATTLTGRYLARAGQPDKAVESWSKLIAAHPEDIGLQEDLLDLLIEENLMEQAIATSIKLTAATKDPYQKAIRRLRTAQIYSLANQKSEAAKEYQAILGLSAQDSWLEREALALVNKLFISQDDSDGWKQFLEEAIVATPKRTALQENMAQHLLSTGNIDEAVALYRNLIQTNPGVRGFREALISLFEQANKNKEASQELTALLEKNQNEPQLWKKLATIHQKLGDQKATADAINKAAALMTPDETGKIQSAQLYLRFQNKETCESILRAAAKEFGPLSEAADGLAVFLATNGKPEEAVTLWVDAAKKADRESLLRISRSLSAHGKILEAYQILADREKEFADDSLVLTALCQAAQLTEKSAQAIPAALTLVKLSTAATDIENSIKVAAALILRSEKNDEIIQQITAIPAASLGELCLLAQLHELTGDTISSEKAITAAATSDASLAAAAMRVSLLETRGDMPGAVAAMRELMAKPGGNKPHFIKRLVDLLENSGDIPAALLEVTKWKTIAPGDKAAWLKHAELFTASGEPERATTELRRACAKFGNDEQMRQKLVTSQIDASAHTDALRMLMQLHDESESTATKIKYASQIASTSMIEGRAEEIEQLFRKRSRDNPTAVAPLLVLREMMVTWQRNEEAAELLLEASRRKPDDIDLQGQCAELFETQGDVKKAETLMQTLAAKHNSIDIKRRLVAFYTRNGNAEKAQALSKEIALNSVDARQIETIAVSMITSKQAAEAIEMLRTASAKFPLDWRISYLYAFALELDDKPEQAYQAFLALSQIQEEIPNYVAPLQQNQGYGYYHYHYAQRNGVDSLYQQIQQLLMTPREAYLQQNSYGYNYGWGNSYGNGMPSQLQLPTNSKTLRRYALVHALTIIKKGPEELAAERIKQLSSKDFPFWNAYVRLSITKDPSTFPALLEESPIDPYMVKLLIRYGQQSRMAQGTQMTSQIKPETWRKISAELAEKDPKTAFEALEMSFNGYPSEKRTEADYQKSIDLLARIPAKERIETLSMLHNIMKSGDDKNISAKQKVQAEALIDEAMKANGNQREYQLKKLGESIEKSALAGDFIKAGEAANEFIKAAEKLNQSQPYYNHYQQQQYHRGHSSLSRIWADNAKPIAPHQVIEQFSYQQLLSIAITNGVQFLTAYNPQQGIIQREITPARAELMKALKIDANKSNGPKPVAKLDIKDPKAFLAGVMKLERPLDRVLVLYACQLPALLDPLLAELVTEEAKPDDKLLFWASAYQAHDKKNLTLAYELAVRCRNTAKRDIQSSVDQQIILIASLLNAEKDSKVDFSAAKSALLRLSKSIVEQEEKVSAAKKLKQFGLAQAAERIVRPTLIRNRSSSSRSPYGSGFSPQKAQDAATLARKGNRAGAATKLYQQIRQVMQQQQGNQSYYLREIREVVISTKLEKDIAAQMRPSENASFKERVEFMQIMCAIDKPDNYANELKALFSENPNDLSLIKLMTRVGDKEIQATLAKKIATLEPEKMMEFGNSFVQDASENSSNMDEKTYLAYLSQMELIISILETQPPEQKLPNTLGWVNSMAAQMQSNRYVDGKNLRAFGAPLPTAPKVDNPLCTKRDEVIHRMALAMIKHKDTSSKGFGILQTGKELWKLDEASLKAISLTSYKKMLGSLNFAVTKKAAARGIFDSSDEYDPFSSYSRHHHYSYNDSSGNDLSMQDALATSAASKPLTKEELLPSLKEKERNLVVTWLNYFTAPTAETTAERKTAMNENMLAFQTSLEIARLVNLPIIPAMSLLLNHKDALAPKRLGYTAPDIKMIQPFLDLAVQAKSQQERKQLLTYVTEQYLGEKKLWPLYEISLMNRRRGSHHYNEIDTRIQAYVSAIQQQPNSSNNYRLYRFLLANEMGEIQQNAQQLYLGENAKSNAAMILNSGLVHFGPGMFLNKGMFLPDKILYFRSTSSDKSEQKNLAKELETVEGDNRFWSRILAARYKQAKGADILPEITREMKSIKAWPENEKIFFAHWLYKTWPDLASSSLKTWLKPDHKGNLAKDEKVIKEIPSLIKDQSCDEEEIKNSLYNLINDDPKKAASLWISTMEACSQLNLPSNASVNSVSLAPHEYLSYSIIDDFDDSDASQKMNFYKMIQFLAALDQAKMIINIGRSSSSLSDIIRRNISNASSLPISPSLSSIKNKRTATAAELILQASGSDSKTANLLMEGMVESMDYIDTSDKKTSELITQWLEKTITPKSSRVAKFGSLFFHTNSNSFRVEKLKKQCIALHQDLYKDKEFSAKLKLAFFSQLVDASSDVFQNQDLMNSFIDCFVECDVNDEQLFSTVFSVMNNLSRATKTSPEFNKRMCREVYPKVHAVVANNNQYRNYDDSISVGWLQSSLKTADKSIFTEFIGKNPEIARGNLDCLIDLMKMDWTEEALALLPKPGIMFKIPAGLLINNGSSSRHQFNLDLEQRLSKFLPNIKDAQQRYRFEAMVSNLRDTQSKDKPTNDRSKRLKTVADRFAAEAPPQRAMRMELLCFLDAGSNYVNLEEMLTYANPLDFADVLEARYNSNGSVPTAEQQQSVIQEAMIVRTMSATLRSGKSEYFIRQMKNLSQLHGENNSYGINQVFRTNLEYFGPSILNQILENPREKQKLANELIEICGNSIVNAAKNGSDGVYSCYILSQMAHSLSGQGGKFVTWDKQLSSDVKSRLKENSDYYFHGSFRAFNKKFIVDSNGKSNMNKLLTMLLSDDEASRYLIFRSTLENVIIKYQFVSIEDLAKVIEAVPDTCLRKPEYLIERANSLIRSKKDFAMADQDYNRARELAATLNIASFAEIANSHQARVYFNNGKKAEAEKLAATVDVSKLSEHDKKVFAPLAKFAKPTPPKNPPATKEAP
jgi:tetratricopeptide (TPR) repeat protein